MDVVRLDARTDFRLEKLGRHAGVVRAGRRHGRRGARRRLAPADRRTHRRSAQTWRSRAAPCTCRAPPWGWRAFPSTTSASSRSRAADYLRIAHEYHTVILDHIPVMNFDTRNAAKRFIILIDTLYDINVKLIASAAAEPDALYQADRRLRGERVQAHRVPPHRDALRKPIWRGRTAPRMQEPAARPSGSSRPDRPGHAASCGRTDNWHAAA